MTDKEIILGVRTVEEFDKVKEQVDAGVFLSSDVQNHLRKLLGKPYYPKGMIVELPRVKENAWLFAMYKCDLCKHLEDEDKCCAFPDGIPFETLPKDEEAECAKGIRFEGKEENYKEFFLP